MNPALTDLKRHWKDGRYKSFDKSMNYLRGRYGVASLSELTRSSQNEIMKLLDQNGLTRQTATWRNAAMATKSKTTKTTKTTKTAPKTNGSAKAAEKEQLKPTPPSIPSLKDVEKQLLEMDPQLDPTDPGDLQLILLLHIAKK